MYVFPTSPPHNNVFDYCYADLKMHPCIRTALKASRPGIPGGHIRSTSYIENMVHLSHSNYKNYCKGKCCNYDRSKSGNVIKTI